MDSLESQLRHHLHGVLVARQGDVLNVVIPNTSLFSADGGINGDDVLEPLGAVLRGYPHVVVQVNGFTDTAGAPDKNFAISQKRATQIAAALAHEGVPQARLSSQGFGETHLRVNTGDDKKDPRNRRIEILLKAKPG
jgi:flagellar motor protein MotB